MKGFLRSLQEAPLSVGATIGATAIITDLVLRILFQKPLGPTGVAFQGLFLLLFWLARRNGASWQDLVQTSSLVRWLRLKEASPRPPGLWLRGESGGKTTPTEIAKHRTARAYEHLWTMSSSSFSGNGGHYQRIRSLLPPGHLEGRVLDAGCGLGADAWQMAKEVKGKVVAVDIALDGLRRLSRHSPGGPLPFPIQADLERLPMRGGSFDFVYSYGVLHHLPNPKAGFQELVRVLKPGGLLTLYLYEDFSTRTWAERALLKMVGILRKATIRMPHQLLYRLCQGISPLIFLTCTVPHRIFKRFSWGRSLAERIPYRHGEGPFRLGADLYDRFAAPIENRYSGRVVESWFREAGLTDIQLISRRGWVAFGFKPA